MPAKKIAGIKSVFGMKIKFLVAFIFRETKPEFSGN